MDSTSNSDYCATHKSTQLSKWIPCCCRFQRQPSRHRPSLRQHPHGHIQWCRDPVRDGLPSNSGSHDEAQGESSLYIYRDVNVTFKPSDCEVVFFYYWFQSHSESADDTSLASLLWCHRGCGQDLKWILQILLDYAKVVVSLPKNACYGIVVCKSPTRWGLAVPTVEFLALKAFNVG